MRWGYSLCYAGWRRCLIRPGFARRSDKRLRHQAILTDRKAKSSPKRAFLIWLGYEDSNLGMPESESGALPLGDTPIVVLLTLTSRASLKLAGVRGFEPRNAGIRIRCLTAWRYPNKLFSNLSNTSTHSEYGGYDGIRTCDPIIMSDVL